MAGVAVHLHSGSTEWESQQHMDNGLSLLPVTSPSAAHSLRPPSLHAGPWASEPHSHLGTVQEESGCIGRSGRVCWLSVITLGDT